MSKSIDCFDLACTNRELAVLARPNGCLLAHSDDSCTSDNASSTVFFPMISFS